MGRNRSGNVLPDTNQMPVNVGVVIDGEPGRRGRRTSIRFAEPQWLAEPYGSPLQPDAIAIVVHITTRTRRETSRARWEV